MNIFEIDELKRLIRRKNFAIFGEENLLEQDKITIKEIELRIQELIDREKKLKPKYEFLLYTEGGEHFCNCPTCDYDLRRKRLLLFSIDEKPIKHNYCPNCGQSLDWSETDE